MDAPTRCLVENLNAKVGQFLETGQFATAAETAVGALRMLWPHVVMDSGVEETTGAAPPERTSLRLYHIPTPSPIEKADERIFAVFAQAFLCHPCGIETDVDDVALRSPPVWTVDECRRIAASTVYNLGLAYHLEGLRGRKDPRVPLWFDKALKAYHASAALLGSTVPDLSTASDDVKLLCLAIANNKGRIYEHLYDGPSMRVCLHELHALLAHTWWSEASAHFHETGIVFPTWESVSLLHPPAA